jgi:hypothetical protein
MEKEIDFETFQKSRWQRLSDRLLLWGHDVGGRFRQKGWIETEAEVVSCSPVRRSRYYVHSLHSPSSVWPALGGWIVEFRYTINGRTYDGATNAPCELQPGEKFPVRYNPSRPEENNSLDSELSWVRGPIVLVYEIFLALILLGALVIDLLHKHCSFYRYFGSALI